MIYKTRVACAAALVLLGFVSIAPVLANPQKQVAGEGTHFRDLFGVVPGGSGNLHNYFELVDVALSSQRPSLAWKTVWPHKNGGYRIGFVKRWIKKHVTKTQHMGVDNVVMLGYAPGWAEDHSPKTYHVAGITFNLYKKNGQLYYKNNSHIMPQHSKVKSSWELAIAKDYVQDWKKYVGWATRKLVAHGVKYFQIWNEPSGYAPFYVGNLNLGSRDRDVGSKTLGTYFDRVSKPAAQAIHAHGGKVVFGGWPTAPGFALTKKYGNSSFVGWLDYHQAWDIYDVLDFHYRNRGIVNAFSRLYKAAKKRGHGNISIWETEIGNTSNIRFVPNLYPRFAMWAIKHNHGHPKRYRLYLYAYASASGSAVSKGRNIGLVYFNHGRIQGLTENGLALKTMGELFSAGDGVLRVYGAVKNNKGIVLNHPSSTSAAQNSIEAFKVGHHLIVAVHLDQHIKGHMKITFTQLRGKQIKSVNRVTPYGQRDNLMNTLRALPGGGAQLTVDTQHIALPSYDESRQYLKSGKSDARTFFVDIKLASSGMKIN